MKLQVNEQVDADKQEKSELSAVASIFSAMDRSNNPRTAAKPEASNDDIAMAAALFINKIIKHNHDTP